MKMELLYLSSVGGTISKADLLRTRFYGDGRWVENYIKSGLLKKTTQSPPLSSPISVETEEVYELTDKFWAKLAGQFNPRPQTVLSYYFTMRTTPIKK